MSPKEKYRELCGKESSIPLFSRDWWLDATAGAHAWDVAIVEKSGKIIAALPYFSRKRLGFSLIGQPALTPALGPWLAPHNDRTTMSLSQQKYSMECLISKLPKFDYFSQNWHSRHTNWLPFFWNGFRQTTRYTYVLKEMHDPVKLMAGFQHHVRSEINKASNRFQLHVREDLPLEALLALNHKTFDRQGRSRPYSDDFVRKLDAACVNHNCRKLFIAVDPAGLHHAATYIVWDENSAYYLLGGGDPSLRTSGAASLCLWEAIKHAAQVSKQFDFEGSMLESVERFFRDFGAVQVPYFNISKTPSWVLRMRQSLLFMMGRQ